MIHLQKQVRKSAEREAKELEEAERQRSEELQQRAQLLSPSSATKTITSATMTTTSTTRRATPSTPAGKLSSSRVTNSRLNATTNRLLLSSTLRQSVGGTGSRAHLARSPMTNRSFNATTSRMDVTKEKSKRALKRAQLLQRKKIFDKQLKDAKARILQDARSGATRTETPKKSADDILKSQSSLSSQSSTVAATALSRPSPAKNNAFSSSMNAATLVSEQTSSQTNSTVTRVTNVVSKDSAVHKFIQDSETAVTSVSTKEHVNKTTDHNIPTTSELASTLADRLTTTATITTPTVGHSSSLKTLLMGSSPSTRAVNNNTTLPVTSMGSSVSKPTSTTTSTLGNPGQPSRIVQGPATFSVHTAGKKGGVPGCPCNVKAMFLCKRCGSAWHGDCIDADTKACISCS